MIQLRTPRVVVLGGGFAGLESAFYLHQRLGDRVEVVLISDQSSFVYKPDTVHIPFGLDPERLRVPLEEPLRRRGIHFIPGRALDVDAERQTVRVTDGRIIGYDRLVIATGADPSPGLIPGLAAAGIPVGSIPAMLELRTRFAELLEDARKGARRRVVFLVPRDRGWSKPIYELCWMLDTWLTWHGARQHVDIALFTNESSYAAPFGPRLDAAADAEFRRRDIHATRNFSVAGVEPGRVVSSCRDWAPFDLLVTLRPMAAIARFPALPTDMTGFLRTTPSTRQVEDFPNIYAVGDASDFPIKQGFLATKQADAAAEHIAAGLLGEPPRWSFDPMAVAILDQLDGALFAQAPLRRSSTDARAFEIAADSPVYGVGASPVGRAGRIALSTLVPRRFQLGMPLHTGVTGAALEAGRRLLSRTLAS
jgi:sulfide:quinone oxidoreductase